jgi:hypothetical protein
MNLDNVTVEMRPRGEWEAADFGARMIRRDARSIYLVWFTITLPMLALALLAVFYSPYPTLAMTLYWWLEPVTDGPILRIISRRLFGERADVRATIRSAFRLAWINRIFWLTPLRFHLARSVAIPVTQLEGLTGADRRARSKVLNLKIFNYGMGVTAAYQHLVLSLMLGIILIGYALIPAGYHDTVGEQWLGLFWFDDSRGAVAASLLVFYIAQTALHPWFVGAGFGLYINCRTQLEAWDIEVAFRRIVQRRASGLAKAAVVLILLAPLMAFPPQALAQQADETGYDDPGFPGFWSDEQVRPAVESVMSSEAMRTSTETEVWRRIEKDDAKPQPERNDSDWLSETIGDFVQLISYIVEFGLWIGVALLLLVIFLSRDRWLPFLSMPTMPDKPARRIFLAGGELTADELPDNISVEVERLWRAGEKRAALSLLYRGSVFTAVADHGVRLPPSATEAACVRAVADKLDTTRSDFFRSIVNSWMRCAYANQAPDDDTVLPLCAEWPRHFGTLQ